MEKCEVDSIIRDILDTRKGSEKSKKKKTTKFFKFISGDESPLEAVQLALGRNEKLQYAQYKALTEIMKFIENFNENKIGECVEALGRILFQCNLLKVLQRILQLRLPDESICKNVPWKIVHYSGLTVLKTVVDFSKKLDHFTKTLVDTDTVELFMEFIEGKDDIMTCYPAVLGLASLCCNSLEARERVIFANGLSKLGHYIYKDNCHKLHVKAHKQGLQRYQKDELDRLKEVHLGKENFKGNMYAGRQDTSYHVLLKWSRMIQSASAQIILKIAEQNDRHRKLVFEDKVISKALVKWIKSPAILQGEVEMIDMSLQVISTLCVNQEIANKLVDDYNITKFLEYGASIPDRYLYVAYTSAYLQLCTMGGSPREAIGDNEKILQALAMFVYSHDKGIRDSVLKTLVRLVNSGPGYATKVIHCGIKPKTLMLITSFYEDDNGYCKTLKQGLNRESSRLWKKEESLFDKTPREFLLTLDADQAVRLKDIGNDKFKSDEYMEAIVFYSRALEVCPPAEKQKKGSEIWKWWVTPAALYSNRAQCYLKTQDWQSAYLDCTQAIARCMEDDPKAASLRTKTAYRRAKALMELGNYHEALNDVAVCMRNNNYKNDDIVSLYRQILVRYRQYVGLEPIRRCAVCLEGEGEKLKRCANCSEVYCSKECQLFGWDNGHKLYCNWSE